MNERNKHVCPVENSGNLDNSIRRWVQNPKKILKPYIKEGMVVLDLGCGPGFFSIDIAQMIGKSGKVIAADLQEGMLHKIIEKIKGTELEERITLHKCEENKIGISENVDFILSFYMIHEVPNVEGLFSEIYTILKPKGQIFIVEPPFHVSKSTFENTITKATDTGLLIAKRPRLFLNKAVLLKKG